MKLERAPMAVLMVGGLLALLPAAASARPMYFPSLCLGRLPRARAVHGARPFGDRRSYFAAPGGTFEAPAWSLAGGATLTGGSGPLRLGPARRIAAAAARRAPPRAPSSASTSTIRRCASSRPSSRPGAARSSTST